MNHVDSMMNRYCRVALQAQVGAIGRSAAEPLRPEPGRHGRLATSAHPDPADGRRCRWGR